MVKEGIDFEELDDGCVLYDTQTDKVHSLNATAAFIWSCCDGKHSVGEIASIVVECFKSEGETALRDVSGIVKTFSDKGLIGA